MKRVVLLVASMDWSSQAEELVVHQAVVVGSVVEDRWLEVVESLLVRGRDGLWVLVLESSGVSSNLRFSIIQHLPSASLATA